MNDADYRRARRLLMRRDPVMWQMIKQQGPCGLADSQRTDPFESIVQAIVWQQLSWKAALAPTVGSRRSSGAAGVPRRASWQKRPNRPCAQQV